MIARPPIIAALAPFAITPDRAAKASENDKAALAALVTVYAPDASGAPEVRAVKAMRTILGGGLIDNALAPAPVDGTPQAAEAAQQALFTAAMSAPYIYYIGPGSRMSPLLGIYTENTGLPWWEVDASGHVVT